MGVRRKAGSPWGKAWPAAKQNVAPAEKMIIGGYEAHGVSFLGTYYQKGLFLKLSSSVPLSSPQSRDKLGVKQMLSLLTRILSVHRNRDVTVNIMKPVKWLAGFLSELISCDRFREWFSSLSKPWIGRSLCQMEEFIIGRDKPWPSFSIRYTNSDTELAITGADDESMPGQALNPTSFSCWFPVNATWMGVKISICRFYIWTTRPNNRCLVIAGVNWVFF